jgi:hypothetical protein
MDGEDTGPVRGPVDVGSGRETSGSRTPVAMRREPTTDLGINEFVKKSPDFLAKFFKNLTSFARETIRSPQ